jgi:hypothetical protein
LREVENLESRRIAETVLVDPIQFGTQDHLLSLQTPHRRPDEFLLFCLALPQDCRQIALDNTSSMLMFRDGEQRDAHFRIAAPYRNRDKTATNLGEASLQGSRQADIIPRC